MAKLEYNIKAYSGDAADLATDETVFDSNALIFGDDDGSMKRGNGVDAYADLDYVVDPAE